MTIAESEFLYLSRSDVEFICQDIDVVAVMREVFQMHGLGQTILPEEAYLNWVNDQNQSVRSLAMPGYLGGSLRVAGTKIINGNICNPAFGLPRASGVTLLYDDASVQIVCIMEGAYLSSLRTAGVTVLATELLRGPTLDCVAVIGAGILARTHIELLIKRFPEVRQILVFDINRKQVETLQRDMHKNLSTYNVTIREAATAEEAIRAAQLIIPVTTATLGYIRFEWLQPGSVLVNVSLDDPLPEVVLQASLIVVDDWPLVKSDRRRLLGRMYSEGRLLGPEESSESMPTARRRVEMQLGELVIGAKAGRHSAKDIILVNPFGLSLEDVALAYSVYQKALALEIGVYLQR